MALTICRGPRARRRSSRRCRALKRVVMAMNSLFMRTRRPERRRMCGSSKAVTLRRLSRPTASATKRTLLLSKRSRWLSPRNASTTTPANTPKRWYRALRMAALADCGRIAALTKVDTRMPRAISSTLHTAAMNAWSGCSSTGRPIIAAV
ncbi:hypothetical protein D9M71_517030 [compost metagenome]